MTRDFRLKEIARQAGLSLATVDRVINKRQGVSTLANMRVAQALQELKRQGEQAGLAGRKYLIDIVVEAPDRFCNLVRQNLEIEISYLHPASFRCRFHMAEMSDSKEIVKILKRIGLMGSNGVILKAPDRPEIVRAIEALADAQIPVVTLVTDIPFSKRVAYVGIDNRAAGETAAYLVASWLPQKNASILVAVSSTGFRGEEEREIGFKSILRKCHSHLKIVEISGGFGLHSKTAKLVKDALSHDTNIQGVYSPGGANLAILEAFAKSNRRPQVFVAHDLDADNLLLLQQNKLTAVLHHDLRADMRMCCLQIMRANYPVSKKPEMASATIQIITPHNIPSYIFS